MPFQPGQSGNPAGRAKGVSTKNNQVVRETIEKILTEGAEKAIEEMKQLKGKDFLTFYTTLAEFAIPKKSRIQYADENEDRVREVFCIDGVEFEL